MVNINSLREMQTKTTMRNCFLSTSMGIIFKKTVKELAKIRRSCESYTHSAGGNEK